jgi:DNA-binding response OmpR family regulator
MAAAVTPVDKTILLVEDDAWLRRIMAELLADDGYQVLEASDGAQALAMVEAGVPDVVVLDLNLPEVSGLEVLHQLRSKQETVSLPVIVMSGALDGETRDRLSRLAERADDLIEKPLDIGLLFERVERAVVG